MGTLLRINKNGEYKTKEFNSYYLAVVEKNRLLKKGVKVDLIDTKMEIYDERTNNRENLLRTIYTTRDKAKLRALRGKYEPELNETHPRGRH